MSYFCFSSSLWSLRHLCFRPRSKSTSPRAPHQTALKPSTRVFIDKESRLYVSLAGEEPVNVELESLAAALQEARLNADPSADDFIAVYADEEVTYGTLVKVLDLGAQNNLKMVLATKPAPATAKP